MHQILKVFYYTFSPDRFIALKGDFGMGKSSLAKQLCHYIQARPMLSETIFSDGVIFLELTRDATP